MTNKTLGAWLAWTLIGALFAYIIGLEDLAGYTYVANWVFVFIAAYRLRTQA